MCIIYMHMWPFVMGIHRSPVDSHHKGPAIIMGVFCEHKVWPMFCLSYHTLHHINDIIWKQH